MNTVDLPAMRAKTGTRGHAIGRFRLQPYRQLSGPDGPVSVKPKALAILSVLAEANGGLVTKDELMAAVWPNVIVEENALQAHVASLRKILGDDAELLSTVHGHGYQLTLTESPPPEAPATPPFRTWRTAFTALAVLLALGTAASLWLFHKTTRADAVKNAPRIAILPFDLSKSGPQGAAFADALKDEVAASLSAAGLLVLSDPGAKGPSKGSFAQFDRQPGVEFLVAGRIGPDGVHMELRDWAESISVWSGTFQLNAGGDSRSAEAVATAVADAAHYAMIGRSGKVRLDAAGVTALVEARESMTAVSRPNPLLQMADYKRIIASTPDFSWAHSGLAAADAFQLKGDPKNEPLRDEARREANRALELDPANGEAYLALELLLPRFSWSEREAILLRGVRAAPGFSPVAYMEGRLRSAVGRNQDALFWYRRGHNIDPLHAHNTFSYAVTLLSQGSPAESNKLLDEMDAQWPQHVATTNAHFWTSVISRAYDKTLAILADPSKWPVDINEKSAVAWRLAITAAKENKRQVEARAAVKEAAAEGSLSRGHGLLLLSMLNDVDGAYEQAEYYLPSDPQWGPLLFLEPTRPMRFDPRFIKLATKLGFAAYWRSTGQWPDFCGATTLPYDCKAEVEKFAASNPTLKPMAEVQRAQIPY